MKIVLFIFAGRKSNMEVQRPYLERLLDEWPEMEIHLWDLTRTPEDAAYLVERANADSRVHLISHLHTGHPIHCIKPPGRPRRGWPKCTCVKCKPPYEKPYQWYASSNHYDDAIFVKMDDDVLFLETDNFAHLVEPLIENPNRIYSANVINNVVCAKYDYLLSPYIANRLALGDPILAANDKRWWAAHTSAEFASVSHDHLFLNLDVCLGHRPLYVRTRPGEAVSINCIAFTHATMKRLARSMNDRLGDEGAVDKMLPWIVKSFHAGHLSFGPQEQKLDLDKYRQQYTKLAESYLSEKTGELAL